MNAMKFAFKQKLVRRPFLESEGKGAKNGGHYSSTVSQVNQSPNCIQDRLILVT